MPNIQSSSVFARKHLDGVIAEYLRQFEATYPGIVQWYEKVADQPNRVVIPALSAGDEYLIGLAVLRRGGPEAKLCHLSIAEAARGHGLADQLFASAMDLARGATSLRFSLPARLYQAHRPLFDRVGAREIGAHHKQYRPGSDELACRIILPGGRA